MKCLLNKYNVITVGLEKKIDNEPKKIWLKSIIYVTRIIIVREILPDLYNYIDLTN